RMGIVIRPWGCLEVLHESEYIILFTQKRDRLIQSYQKPARMESIRWHHKMQMLIRIKKTRSGELCEIYWKTLKEINMEKNSMYANRLFEEYLMNLKGNGN